MGIIRLLSSYIRSVFESYKDHISSIGLKRVVEFYEEKIIDIACVNSIVAEISKSSHVHPSPDINSFYNVTIHFRFVYCGDYVFSLTSNPIRYN